MGTGGRAGAIGARLLVPLGGVCLVGYVWSLWMLVSSWVEPFLFGPRWELLWWPLALGTPPLILYAVAERGNADARRRRRSRRSRRLLLRSLAATVLWVCLGSLFAGAGLWVTMQFAGR